jgi:hypothetical protein
MNAELDRYYTAHDGRTGEYLQQLRELILAHDAHVTEAWKYGMPFFCYKGKMFCYLWTDRENGWPYLGVVEGQRIFHPQLVQGERARMKVLLIDPNERLPEATVRGILDQAIVLYTSGIVRLPKR